MKKIWKIIIVTIAVVVILKFVVSALWIGGVFSTNVGEKRVTEIYQNNRDIFHSIAQFLSNLEYDNIYITDTMEDGIMFAGIEDGDTTISDFSVADKIKDIMTNHKCNVIDKYDNAVVFQLWSAKDKGVGVVYSTDGNIPKVRFLTKICQIEDNGWYYYEEDFNKWKLQNE